MCVVCISESWNYGVRNLFSTRRLPSHMFKLNSLQITSIILPTPKVAIESLLQGKRAQLCQKLFISLSDDLQLSVQPQLSQTSVYFQSLFDNTINISCPLAIPESVVFKLQGD